MSFDLSNIDLTDDILFMTLLESVSDKDKEELQKLRLKQKMLKSPLDYMEAVLADKFLPGRHISVVNEQLMKSVNEGNQFTIISLPVRHGKSYLSSEFFPAWYMTKYPEKRVMILSHSLSFSVSLASSAKNIFEQTAPLFGLKLSKSKAAKGEWGVEGYNKGGVVASGYGVNITGRGADIIIVDDIYGSHEDAFSTTHNQKLRNWWLQTIRTRFEPGASAVIVLARWGEKDFAGWLLDKAAQNDKDTQWKEIRMPAIAYEEDDYLGREIGEPLWPERYDIAALEVLKNGTTPQTWAAQYQQDPKTQTDVMFPEENWKYYPEEDSETGKISHWVELNWLYGGYAREIPKTARLVRAWDLTAGGPQSDFLVGVLMARDREGFYYIIDVQRKKFKDSRAMPEIEKFIQLVTKRDAELYQDRVVTVLEEVGGIGKSLTHYFVKLLQDTKLEIFNAKDKSKQFRALPFATMQQTGNVYLVKERSAASKKFKEPEWFEPFIGELGSVRAEDGQTSGYDDQLDAATMAFLHLGGSTVVHRSHGTLATTTPGPQQDQSWTRQRSQYFNRSARYYQRPYGNGSRFGR